MGMVGTWMTPRNTLLALMCYPTEFGLSRSNSTIRALLTDTPDKPDTSRTAFQCHSRSLESTRVDPPPMTSY